MKSSIISRVLRSLSITEGTQGSALGENEFFFGKQNEYEIEIANTVEKRIKAYQLIYQLYRKPEVDYCDQSYSKMWYSFFDASPFTVTIIITNRGTKKTIAALTLVLDSDFGIPGQNEYPVEVELLRSQDRRIAEIISLGIDESVFGKNEILSQLFKFAYLTSKAICQTTDFLIMVKPTHASFYERKLSFTQLGDIRQCQKIKNHEVGLFRLDILSAEEESLSKRGQVVRKRRIFDHFKTSNECSEEMNLIRELIRPLSYQDFHYLFVELTPLLGTAPKEKLLLLESYFSGSIQRLIRSEIDVSELLPEVVL